MAFAKSARLTPTRRNHAGGLLSNFHATVPAPAALLGSLASTKTTMCGLTQSTLVSLPLIVMRCATSNSAVVEWCARSGDEPASRDTAANSRRLTGDLAFYV